MKNLKLLNKKYLSIFTILILSFSLNLKAEDEPVDIWKLEKKVEENSSIFVTENDELIETENGSVNTDPNKTINTIDSNILGENKISIVGLYDPEDHGLRIDMWSNSNGNEIKIILKKIDKMNLSID